MFTMQEVAALKVALKRNSKEHLEDWIARWESKNGDLLLEQFEKGISQEIQIQIYYHENDNYDECVMIGDSLSSDINPAKALGMKTIYISKDNENTESTINDIRKLKDIL